MEKKHESGKVVVRILAAWLAVRYVCTPARNANLRSKIEFTVLKAASVVIEGRLREQTARGDPIEPKNLANGAGSSQSAQIHTQPRMGVGAVGVVCASVQGMSVVAKP